MFHEKRRGDLENTIIKFVLYVLLLKKQHNTGRNEGLVAEFQEKQARKDHEKRKRKKKGRDWKTMFQRSCLYYCEHCGRLQLVELGYKSFALLIAFSFCSLDKEKEAVRF